MCNTENTKLQNLLETYDSILVVGTWGVGKTYLWEQYAEDAEKPVYVSLMGIQDISGFHKEALGAINTIRTISKEMSYFKVIPWEAIEPIIYKKYIQNSVVCLDDLDRSQISISVLSGIIEDIKRHGGKVVLLSNTDAYENKETFSGYKEKLFDTIWNYTDNSHAMEQVIQDFNINYIDYATTKEVMDAFNTHNIRFIHMAKNHTEYIIKHIPESTDSYQEIFSCIYRDVLVATILYHDTKQYNTNGNGDVFGNESISKLTDKVHKEFDDKGLSLTSPLGLRYKFLIELQWLNCDEKYPNPLYEVITDCVKGDDIDSKTVHSLLKDYQSIKSNP